VVVVQKLFLWCFCWLVGWWVGGWWVVGSIFEVENLQ